MFKCQLLLTGQIRTAESFALEIGVKAAPSQAQGRPHACDNQSAVEFRVGPSGPPSSSRDPSIYKYYLHWDLKTVKSYLHWGFSDPCIGPPHWQVDGSPGAAFGVLEAIQPAAADRESRARPVWCESRARTIWIVLLPVERKEADSCAKGLLFEVPAVFCCFHCCYMMMQLGCGVVNFLNAGAGGGGRVGHKKVDRAVRKRWPRKVAACCSSKWAGFAVSCCTSLSEPLVNKIHFCRLECDTF